MTTDILPVNFCENAATVSLHATYGEPINILIVDDEPKNLTVLEVVLDDPGYRLVRAESANQALLALVKEEFALIILDIRMPGMTGFELAMMIKERKKIAYVPIIFLTAYYNEDQHVLEGYHTGAVDYLHKPVNPAILRSKVAVFAELFRKNRECALTCQALLAEMTVRRSAQEQLRVLNDTLENRVAERTTELLAANTALHETGERYSSLFEGSLDAIISLNCNGRFEAANPAVLRLTGYTLEDLKNINFVDICAPEQRKFAKRAFRAAFSGECIMTDITIINASGDRRDLFLSGVPVFVSGKLVGVSCIARDVTERNQLDQILYKKNLELQNAKTIAEKANQAKSSFLSSMSHELRTPLNAILGFAQLLESGTPPPTESQDKRLQQILKAGWYLLELINEILDLSVIESGKLVLQIEQVPLAEVILDCQNMILTEATKREIQVTFISCDNDLLAMADRTRLKQVLVNLLSNAVKYNRNLGTVELTCLALSDERLRITIKDSGHGLSSDKIQQLFQPFNRLGQESSSEEGTGIGLVVAKQLVELMGGSIGVESTIGVGSEFWVELVRSEPPLFASKKIPSAHPGENTPGAITRYKLLYVEDNPANLLLVEEILADHPQISMLSAKDGEEGIALAHKHLPDVILMDVNLPGISGVEAMQVLHGDVATSHIPIIALSANAMLEDIEKGIAAGFFRYLTKPVIINELMAALNESMRHTAKGQACIKITKTIQTGEIS